MMRLNTCTRKSLFRSVLVSFLLLFHGTALWAGELHLRDGSLLIGTIQELREETFIIKTTFAERLEVPADQVEGVITDEPVMATLSNGERLLGTLQFSPQQGQRLTSPRSGEVVLSETLYLVGLSEPDATPDQEVEPMAEQDREEARTDPWSGSIALGLNGAEGNTERFGINGRAETRRETNGDRLMFYIEGNLQRENGVTTANEVLTGGSLERDLDRHWFVFGSADFEKDEFENLELRALTNLGIGHFLIRREELTWKALAGIGYQHETFEDGTVEDEGIVSFGYDLKYHYNSWLELLHKLTYLPSLSAPVDDYRLVSNLGAQMPIGHTENWKLRLNLRNQYDSSPRPGIEELDTVYSLNLVYDFP